LLAHHAAEIGEEAARDLDHGQDGDSACVSGESLGVSGRALRVELAIRGNEHMHP
jgi:hypothetical protein